MKVLIIADEIQSLKPAGDTGLSMLRGALARSHDVSWASFRQLHFFAEEVWVKGDRIKSCDEKELPETEPFASARVISEFDQVWIRKDPPFDQTYISLCWWLALYEERIRFVNQPSKLIRYHEKALPYEACHRGFVGKDDLVQTYVSLAADSGELPYQGQVIEKPWLGYGGNEIKLLDSVPQKIRPLYMYQPFAPAVTRLGDRRVFVIDGRVVGDFVRLPASGSIEANLAQGGSVSLRPMDENEKRIANAAAKFLAEIGITIAGLDLLAGKLSEINITAPTGFETLRNEGQVDLREVYLDAVERL